MQVSHCRGNQVRVWLWVMAMLRGGTGAMYSRSRWRKVFAFVFVALFATGCSLATVGSDGLSTMPTVQLAPAIRSGGSCGVSFCGQVQATQQVSVAPKVAGRVTRLLVAIGSQVRAGEVLVELDTDAATAQVAQAAAALAAAQARLDSIMAGPRREMVAQAEANLSMAQERLASLERGGRPEQIAQAEANLAGAQARLAQVQRGATGQDVQQAKLAIDQAKNALWAAQSTRDGLCGNPSLPKAQCHAAEAAVAMSETGVRQAEVRLAQLQAGATTEVIAQAEAVVRAAAEQLKLAKQPASKEDISQAQGAVRLSEAQLALAKRPFTEHDRGAAEATVAQLRAALDLANLQVAEATVRAPFSGIVAQCMISEGSMASPMAPLLTLISIETELVINVDEAGLPALRAGLPAMVTTDACPGVTFRASVAAVAPSIDAASRTVRVRLTPDDPQGMLRDGMLARVEIAPDGSQGALLVPASAVIQGSDGPAVYVLGSGKAQRRPVRTGAADGEQVAVTEGLNEGERVIINPSGIVDGQIVIAQ